MQRIRALCNVYDTHMRRLWQRRFHAEKTLPGWKVKQTASIPEFEIDASLLEHTSGSQLLHVKRKDPNATFSVGFRTVPKDSTGLPHILEHTVLCGSDKYNVRDPFFNMLNRSLATFMNAMTAPDSTFYPFSSQNAKDCQNLQSVYLDAVFAPKLSIQDFRQEGWRLEHENPEDKSTPIVIKGVVFNEMKGVFSDNQNLYSEALLNGLLPSHTYGVCSGGLPSEIPKLKHKDLVEFHQNHYSPKNAKFYMYGQLPLEEHMRALEPYLEKKRDPVPPIPTEPRWTEMRRKHISCRPDTLAANPEKQGCVTTSFLCCDIREIQEVFTLQIISELLVRGPNASFYSTLVEPNIGAGLAPTTGYEPQTRDTFFSVGLQGVDPKDFTKVEEIINSTLQDVVKNGFPAERVEAVLHGLELGVKHQSANFGLSVLFSICSLWNHDGDVLTSLGIEKQIAQFRADLKADPEFLQKKVEKYLVKNNHRLVLTMSPDPEFEAQLKKAEEALLKEKLEALSKEELGRVYTDGLELLESRKKVNKDVLPTLRIADIPKEIVKVTSDERTISSVPVSVFRQPTNGVSYFRALLGTESVDPELQPYLSVYANVATKMGTKQRNFREFDQLVSLYTGGLGIGCHITEGVQGPGFEGSVLLGSHCLDRNLDCMFDLWREVLQEGDLEDASRFGTLTKAMAANMVNSVPHAGHNYAMSGAAALISEAAALSEAQSGMTFLNVLNKMAADEPEKGLETVKKIRKSLLKAPLRCSINALPSTDLAPLDRLIERLSLPGSDCQLKTPSATPGESRGRLHILPFDVSYASKALPTVPYVHPDFAALRIFSRFLTLQYLHPEIREKGGAYGGGVSLSLSGLLRFYSYRDPAPVNSLKVFDGSLEWLKSHVPSAQDLEEAKLGVFQSVDAPVAPGARGSNRFLNGITDDLLEEHRRRLMAVTADDILSAAEKYLKAPSGTCVLGPKNEDITKNSDIKWEVSDS